MSDDFRSSVDNARSDGDWVKFKEGDNRMRILSEPTIKVSRFGHGICYEGAPYCQKVTLDKELADAKEKAKAEGKKDWDKITIKMPSKKWCAWAILRGKDGGANTFGIVELPYGVSKTLRELMDSDEAGFKSFPMPYDINIKAKGAGSMGVEYTVIASRTSSEVTDEERIDFEKLTPVSQILDRMKDKQRQKTDGGSSASTEGKKVEYPREDINPDDIPF